MRIYKVRLKITDKQTDKNQYPGKQPKSFSVGRESKKVLLSVGNVPENPSLADFLYTMVSKDCCTFGRKQAAMPKEAERVQRRMRKGRAFCGRDRFRRESFLCL